MRWFKESEFKNSNPPCSIDQMDPMLLQMIDVAREKAGIEFVINSAYRSKEYELEQGRDGTSSHTKGLAIDIQAHGTSRLPILLSLLDVGFQRIGIYDWGFHVDIDKEKPIAVWTG